MKDKKFLFMYSSQPGLDDDFIAQPLGILYLGAILREEGVSVKCMDERISAREALCEAIQEADVVGISAMTPFLKRALDWGAYAKAKGKTTLMGGAHATVDPHSLLDAGHFDIVFIGEAEITIREALPILGDREKLKGVKGLGFFDGQGQKFLTEERPFNQDLDAVPFPAWDMLPIEDYFNRNKERLFYIFTSRGCPYSCVFCQKKLTGRGFRTRSVPNILDELEQIVKRYDPGNILFIDELFTCQKKRVLEICKGILERGLKLNWACETRVDRVDYEMMMTMRRAGMRRMYFGIESGSPASLKTLNKRFTVDQIIETLRTARRADIWTKVFLIVGTPNETEEDFALTAQMLKEAHPDMVRTSLFNPLIASPSFDLYRDRIDMDLIFTEYVDSEGTPYRHEHFSVEELNRHKHRLRADFEAWYGKPAQRLKRKLSKLRFFLENPEEGWRWLRGKVGSNSRA
jgi:radical SAM superfamily enzyme YgiQ (UPF0313 family)